MNKIKGTLTILVSIISLFTYSQSNIFKVTLDAGHGAHDFGAVYSGRIEKNIALAVVLKVGKILEPTPNIDVIYTRKTDVFIDLIERANIANRADANIFVSIHCNANPNTLADGTETYVMGMTKVASNLEAAKKENSVVTLEKDYKQKYEGFDPNSPETMIGMTLMQEEYLENSISLASKVEDAFLNLGKKVRGGGVKQAPYMVLHKAYMPRVLIEMGFISNTVEGNTLNSEEGQDEVAGAIAEAIIRYKKEYYGNGETENSDLKSSQKIIEKPIRENTNSVKPKVILKTEESKNPINEISNSAKSEVIIKSLEIKKTIKDISTPVKPEVILKSLEIKKPEMKTDASGIIYKVQLSASIQKVELVPKNFKGLNSISISFEDKVYKYMYGETSDYDEANRQLKEARAKGFKTAYIIVFRNGEKISIREAHKL